MSIPSKALGYGNNSVAQNVFRITYSTALSSPPRWEAYDSAQTFPAIDIITTTINTIFTGTVNNANIPMLSLISTSSVAPTSAWKPTVATAGSVNPNRLKGQTNTITDTTTPGAGASIRWNMVLEIPSDATTSSTMSHDLLNRYTYTGATPILTWSYNDSTSGTEGVPTWVTLVPGTHGIRHCRAGTTSGGPYLLTIPLSSTVDSVEGWITT